MLCCKPLMDAHPPPRSSASARVALGALRLSSPALAASSPALFELALPTPCTPCLLARDECSRAPRFDLAGLRWAPGARLEAQVRPRTSGGRWTRWTPLPRRTAGDVEGTGPVFTGAADEFEPRLRGQRRDPRLRFVRALPYAPAPRARAAQSCGAVHRPAREPGRRRGAAALGAELR